MLLLGGSVLLIKRDVLEAIKRGEITLQFRRWTRPSVKPGGTLKTKVGLLRIGRMDAMRPEDVGEADARRAGFRDIAEFRSWLAAMKEGPLFHRIEIGYLEEAGSAGIGTSAMPAHCEWTNLQEARMHKDEVKGAAKQARGHVKDAIGKATGDSKLRTDGALDKAEGRVQQEVGKAKEKVRDALKH